MPRVLVISYFMPPATGPGGVNRICKYLRYLPQHGFEPTVLTASLEEAACAWAPITDERSVACRVERVGRANVSSPRTRLRRLRERLFTLPDLQAGWIELAFQAAVRIIRQQAPDLVITTSPPFSVAMLGARLRRELGIPWVCDCRDPWTDYFLGMWPTRLHYRICRKMERETMDWPDALIAITPGHQRIVERNWPLLRGRVVTITNGFDDERLTTDCVAPAHPSGRVEIVYSGSFCGPSDPQDCPSLGQRLFSFRPRDFRPEGHSARYLLAAMAVFLRRHPEWRGRLTFSHLGVPDRSAERYAARLELADSYRSVGYVSAQESARLQASASALFLCVAHSPSGDYNDCVPQKTYEYLATGRPVLAAVPDGDARSFLLRAGTGLVCDTADVAGLAAAIGLLAEMAEGRRAEPCADWEFIRQFRASNLASRLASVFDALLRRPSELASLGEFPHDICPGLCMAQEHQYTESHRSPTRKRGKTVLGPSLAHRATVNSSLIMNSG